MVVVGNIMCQAEFLFKYSYLMIINIMTFWRSALKTKKKKKKKNFICKNVTMSLLVWAVGLYQTVNSGLRNCTPADSDFQEMMGVCGVVATTGKSNRIWCLVLESELTEIYSSSKIYTDDVLSVTDLELNSISFEALKFTVRAVGTLTSQGQLITCSCTIIFEAAFTELLGSISPSPEPMQ